VTPGEIAALMVVHFTPDRTMQNGVLDDWTRGRLLNDGLIESSHGGTMQTTMRGVAMVEALSAVPLPIQRWVMP
jgi:hypothetical protein